MHEQKSAIHTTYLSRGNATYVLSIFGAGFFLSFALRTVNASIAQELLISLELTKSQLGSLTSAYFLGFVVMQLPLGVLLDQYGARRTNTILLALAALGCLGFATATSFWALWLSRVLMGVGLAATLMAALKAFRFWYRPERQQQLVAWMLIAGTSGALCATVPVRYIVDTLGWRWVFIGAALLLLIVAVLMYAFVPSDISLVKEQQERAHKQTQATHLAVYRTIFTDGYFWKFGLLSLLSHGGLGAMQSLWAGPWFMDVQGMSVNQAANALLYYNTTLLISYFVLSWLWRSKAVSRISMTSVAAWAAVVSMVLQVVIGLISGTYAWLVWLPLAMVATCFTMLLPHVTLSFRPEITGRAYVSYNLLIFSGNWLIQWSFGVSIDYLSSLGYMTEAAFRLTMLLWVCVQLTGLVWLICSKSEPSYSDKLSTPSMGSADN